MYIIYYRVRAGISGVHITRLQVTLPPGISFTLGTLPDLNFNRLIANLSHRTTSSLAAFSRSLFSLYLLRSVQRSFRPNRELLSTLCDRGASTLHSTYRANGDISRPSKHLRPTSRLALCLHLRRHHRTHPQSSPELNSTLA